MVDLTKDSDSQHFQKARNKARNTLHSRHRGLSTAIRLNIPLKVFDNK